jgi:hypothetical protein
MRSGAIAAVLVGAAVPTVEALAAPKPGDTVAVTACVRPGVEASCLIVDGADGAVFDVTSAKPKPPLDVMVRLRGTVTDKVSACNQGIVLDRISWTATRQKRPN